jgi:hypothetical protein
MPLAVQTMIKMVVDPNTPASVRVRAAEVVANHSPKAIEIEDVEARVTALEEAAGEQGAVGRAQVARLARLELRATSEDCRASVRFGHLKRCRRKTRASATLSSRGNWRSRATRTVAPAQHIALGRGHIAKRGYRRALLIGRPFLFRFSKPGVESFLGRRVK